MSGFDVGFGAAFLAGLFSFLSPCMLPLIPPYLCFLGGVTFDELQGNTAQPSKAGRGVFIAALAFVFGFGTVFVALGVTASIVGQVLIDNLAILTPIAGAVVIVLGLHFLGVFRINILNRDIRFHGARRPAGAAGAYAVGLAFAFGWTPCIGPVLAVILILAAGDASQGRGAALLAVYSAGIGLPFLAASLAVRPFLAFLARFGKHLRRVEQAMGVLLVATGVLFITGTINDIANLLLEIFPGLGRIG
jgi:cytochrome c-type biogenesis protein